MKKWKDKLGVFTAYYSTQLKANYLTVIGQQVCNDYCDWLADNTIRLTVAICWILVKLR